MQFIGEGLTFDDVLLVPGLSEVLPDETILKTGLTKKIELNVPMMSAGMDTVTESKMAIATARQGGIGIIHKSMTIEEQAREVDRVRRSENGMITDPFYLSVDDKIVDALKLMSHYRISGVPIVKEDVTLVGILTNRDVRFVKDEQLPIGDVMTEDNLITGHKNISMDEVLEKMMNAKIEKLPIVDENFKLKGLITAKDVKESIQYPNLVGDPQGRLLAGAAVGITTDTIGRCQALMDAKVDVVTIDAAHGHSRRALNAVTKLKRAFPNLQIAAGNAATADATRDLVEVGADYVKVGIGPGSIYTTRVITGIGVPQMTAITECAKEVDKYDISIIADGGIKYSGDITKALTAGAPVITAGSLFAGTEGSPGELVVLEDRQYEEYREIGSLGAMGAGSGDRYFQNNTKKYAPEGVEGRVAYKGSVAEVVYQLVGGLRSGMGYVGSKDLIELKEKPKLVKISPASLVENRPHDTTIIRGSPNYIKK